MNAAIITAGGRFAVRLAGGIYKPRKLSKQFPKTYYSFFFQGRCIETLVHRSGSANFSEVFVQRIGERNLDEEVRSIVELAIRASSRRDILRTDFLTPPVLKESVSALEKLGDVKTVVQGGYPQAERCRISIGNPEVLMTDPDAVAALSISGNFGFEHCSHGDFLGSIIGTGIVREKVGDILLQGKEGAQVVVVPELVEFLISALKKVGNVPVSCQQISLLALEYEPPRSGNFILNEIIYNS